LIDLGTAGAGEVVASARYSNGNRGEVVGERSFGANRTAIVSGCGMAATVLTTLNGLLANGNPFLSEERQFRRQPQSKSNARNARTKPAEVEDLIDQRKNRNKIRSQKPLRRRRRKPNRRNRMLIYSWKSARITVQDKARQKQVASNKFVRI